MSTEKRTMTYFRRHEFGSTTERAGSRAIVHIFLTETVISNLDMSIKCQHDVIELEITVHNTVLVEVLECQTDFCSIESERELVCSRHPSARLLTELSSCRNCLSECATSDHHH